MATGFAAQPDSKRRPARRWRSVLAALISLALALSFLHSSGFDADDDIASVAAVQLDLSDLAELATGHRREEGVRG